MAVGSVEVMHRKHGVHGHVKLHFLYDVMFMGRDRVSQYIYGISHHVHSGLAECVNVECILDV